MIESIMKSVHPEETAQSPDTPSASYRNLHSIRSLHCPSSVLISNLILFPVELELPLGPLFVHQTLHFAISQACVHILEIRWTLLTKAQGPCLYRQDAGEYHFAGHSSGGTRLLLVLLPRFYIESVAYRGPYPIRQDYTRRQLTDTYSH